MSGELKCFACGIKKSECKRFYNSSKYSDGKPVCSKHVSQLSRYGRILDITKFDRNDFIIYDTFSEMIIKNSKNEIISKVKIDLEDVNKVKDRKWYLDTHGYIESGTGGKRVRLHRFIMGVTDKNIHIDHINHDVKDNRKQNLRLCTNQENSRNKSIARSNTGYIGVSYVKRDNVYQASIKVNYKKINLGQSKNMLDALKARLEAEKKYFGEFAPQRHLFEEYGIEVDKNARQ